MKEGSRKRAEELREVAHRMSIFLEATSAYPTGQLQIEYVKVHVYFLCADARLVSVETAVQALNIEKSAEEDGFGLDYTIMASLK